MSLLATVSEQERPPRGELESNDEECPICLEVPSEVAVITNYGEGFKTLNACGHKVCQTCVSNMLRTIHYSQRGLTCPLCRAIDTSSIDMDEEGVELQIPRTPGRIKYVRLLHQAAARTMNRTRVINGPLGHRAAIPQQVPVFCLRCEKPGCKSKSKTKRRCSRHPKTPCCRTCVCCELCENERQTDV